MKRVVDTKKILSFLLGVVLCMSFLPGRARATNESWLWPVEGSKIIGSNFGMRDLYGTGSFSNFHSGIDISCAIGTAVRSTKSGSVIDCCYKYGDQEKTGPSGMASYGNYVAVKHTDGTYAIYAHLKNQQIVSIGDAVAQGQIIAYSGNSGNSGGPHCHFQATKNPNPSWSNAENLINTMPTEVCIRDLGLTVVNTYCEAKGYSTARTTYVWQDSSASSVTVPDGMYRLIPKNATGSRLDAEGGVAAECGNVIIWTANDHVAQKYQLARLSNGYYTVTVANSNMVLDMQDGGSQAGTNVWLYPSNGTDAQQWLLTDAGDGYYNIRPKKNTGLCLDVDNGWSSDGTNVKTWDDNGSDAQKWKLEPTSNKCYLDLDGYQDGVETETIVGWGTCDIYINGKLTANDVTDYYESWPAGTKYEIKDIKAVDGKTFDGFAKGDYAGVISSEYTRVILSFSTKVVNAGGKKAAYIPDGVYTLSPACALGSNLDIYGAGLADGDNAQIYSNNGTIAQQFRLESMGKGYYAIYAQCSGKALDVANSSTDPETNVLQWTYHGGDNQLWMLTDAGNGYYNIRSKLDLNLCLDVYLAASDDESNVQVYTDNGTNAQKWKLTPVAASSLGRVDVHFRRVNLYNQGQFTDVPANQWYTNNVAEAYELGLMKGTSATTFSPYGDVTLAEAITMAARIHSIYSTGTEGFNQNAGGAWYQTYLDYAYNNGIISSAFYNADVTKRATRAQFAQIFANALPPEALYPMNSVADNAIPDVPTSASYASYVYKLYRAGILIGGDANGTFSPQTYITRAESAAIVSRMGESNNRVSITLR